MFGREVRLAELEKRLYRFLLRTGIRAPVVRAREVTPTAEAAAFELGVPLFQIVQTRVFRHESATPSFVVAIVPGDRKVDVRRLAQCCGLRKLRAARPAEVWHVAGCAPGGVAAVGFARDATVVIDPTVMEPAVVVCGGGRADLLMLIRPCDIVGAAGARVCPIVRENR
jgi:Ala-tRNA(Pro) deacylase